MKLKVINPNTNAGMTRKIAAAAEAAACQGTRVQCVNPADGPESIEGHYDEALSQLGVLTEVMQGEREGYDAYVIACFGDPGLLAAREIARGPVVGIAEAAMKTATLLATTFSVVTTLARTRIICEHLLLRYGLERHCRRVRATDLPVLELEKRNSKAREIIFEECRKAVRDDSCGAIVLGCAGMSDLAHDLSREIGVPVIEGVSAAVRLTEGLVSLGLATSKAGDLAYPVPKHYAGRLAEFAPSDLAPAIITG